MAGTVVHGVAAGDRRRHGASTGGLRTGVGSSRSARSFQRRAMGSALRLTVTGASAGVALLAWGRVSDEFERAEGAMSRFRESSDLTRLNRAASRAGMAGAIDVDARLRRALVAAWRAQRLTGGRFDPRVLLDLERLDYRGASLPDRHGDPERAGDPDRHGDPDRTGDPDAPAPVGDPGAGRRPDETRWLTVVGRRPSVAVAEPVDLGGIGKGLALRWAWRRLWSGLTLFEGAGALLEAGGDIVAGGPSPDGGPWLVGIDDPATDASDRVTPDQETEGPASGPMAVVSIERGAVCTSSIAVHRWRDSGGRLVHHLVDPLTGEPGGEGLLSVTVSEGDPAWAEVWSKALFLEGARGIADAARRRGLAAWWVTAEGSLEMTPAARLRTAWTR